MFAAHSISQLLCTSLPRQLVTGVSTSGGQLRLTFLGETENIGIARSAADKIAEEFSVALLAVALQNQRTHALAGRFPTEDGIEVGDEGSGPK